MGAGRAAEGTATQRTAAGQSLVEFGVTFPVLIFLLLGVADLGRIFSAGVIVESATRNAAEAAALEYERNPPGDPATVPEDRLFAPAPTPGSAAYYDDLHAKAARVACADMRTLPNTTFDDVTGLCATWPVVRVCIHDGADSQCAQPIPGFNAAIPAECGEVAGFVSSASTAQAGQNRDVTVWTCYPFTTLFELPLLSFMDVHLQRGRVFSVPCYFDPALASC
jgi:hypothetical protein